MHAKTLRMTMQVLFFFSPLGWGKIKHPGSSYHILQQAMIPPIDNAKCKQKIQASGGKATKTSCTFYK